MSVPRSRLLELMKAQCQIFSTVYNPEGLRLGNKVLRQRLRGPALLSYYPRKTVTLKHVNRIFGPDLETWDDKDVDRLDHIDRLKQRGKSAPKKKTGPPDIKKKKK